VRLAVEADIPAIVELGRLFHARSSYADKTYSPEKVTATVKAVIETGTVLVSGDPIHSMGAAIKGPMWFSEGDAAQELFLWGPDGKMIREALEAWATDQGCDSFSMVCLEDDKAVQMTRLYRMAGYKPVERHFLKALAWQDLPQH
jgi:hypothetical protein